MIACSGGDQRAHSMFGFQLRGTAVRILIAALLPLALSGCLAKTALDLATLPVRAASKTVDVLTTSQSEADEKRGRAIREREECIGREDRRAARERRQPDYSRCPKA